MYTPENVFVVLTVASATLMACWVLCVVLQQRRLKRATVILAAISGLAAACVYVSIWGFTLSSF
jgi:hypothetical protein